MYFAPQDQPDFEKIQRVLVIKLLHHGDVLLTSPVFSTLKRLYPHLILDALIYQETQPMLDQHPAIHAVYTIDREWKKQGVFSQFQAERRLLQQLRHNQYDLIIHLDKHPRGAWLSYLLKPRYSLAPQHAKSKTWLWKKSITHFYPMLSHRPRHTVEKNLDALRRLGISAILETDKKLVFAIPQAILEGMQARLATHHALPKQFIHIHPASRWFFKCWDLQKVAQVIQELRAQGEIVVVTAAPDPNEMALIAELRKYTQDFIDLSGQLSLKELGAVIQLAKIFIGVDSAPMHMAAALNTPLIVLFGPSGEQEWAPWMVKHFLLTGDEKKFPCRPCGLDGCGGGKYSECLQSISAKRVLIAAYQLMLSPVLLHENK